MLRLSRHSESPVPLEAPCIAPDRLAALSLAEIERLTVQHGNRTEPLAEHFRVGGDPADRVVEVDGDCSRVEFIGAKMAAGEVRVRGSCGMHAGAEMTGGALHITGHAGDWLGAEMRGGLIRVQGHAGHHAGAGYPGSRRGMRGGTLLVDGTAGDGVGAVMRRGLIAVGGAGDFAGASMIAGSLFVFGATGRYVGAEMKRGSIVVVGPAPELLPTFVPSGEAEFPFLAVYCRRLAELGFDPASRVKLVRTRRYAGDLVTLGKGEILHLSP